MKKTDDVFLGFIKELVNHIRNLGIDWHMPANFSEYSGEDQRRYIHNLRQICQFLQIGDLPEMPGPVIFLMLEGRRPNVRV